ncbi:MAG: hypothetical protein IAI48_00645 [Candidatus Eremiobacteraeota bacterium]|nr:hypothetical protein [Candidatus Eremiobacteraeota bacterium]
MQPALDLRSRSLRGPIERRGGLLLLVFRLRVELDQEIIAERVGREEVGRVDDGAVDRGDVVHVRERGCRALRAERPEGILEASRAGTRVSLDTRRRAHSCTRIVICASAKSTPETARHSPRIVAGSGPLIVHSEETYRARP